MGESGIFRQCEKGMVDEEYYDLHGPHVQASAFEVSRSFQNHLHFLSFLPLILNTQTFHVPNFPVPSLALWTVLKVSTAITTGICGLFMDKCLATCVFFSISRVLMPITYA